MIRIANTWKIKLSHCSIISWWNLSENSVARRSKHSFLGNAYALLFPIDWPEPFGLVMIESMACGTPVIAYRRGSVPEVIDPGLTGFVVDSIDESVSVLGKVPSLDRRICREVFERRFSSGRMAVDYLKIYEQLLTGRKAVQ
jgi:glycosyltransferase involved in cell wall biosynthesis